jgi:uncharacterized membrane protein
MGHPHFSFSPFGLLYCLTLFSFLAVFLFNRVMLRHQVDKRTANDAFAVLKYRYTSGEITEEEYMKFMTFLQR